MKKAIKSYMMAIVAVMLVAGFSAFKVGARSADQDLHWYQKDLHGNYIYDGFMVEPSSGCDGPPVDVCAKGFTDANNPSNPSQIDDNTQSDDTRYYD